METQHGNAAQQVNTPLAGLRVVELADEQAEYCGLVLACLGAEVIKVEPPDGSPTRRIGPFYQNEEDPEKSLFFWNYNRGKKSVVLDIEQESGRTDFLKLLGTADIFLDSTPRGQLDAFGLDSSTLLKKFPSLIFARITPFGDTGPWADYKASDLVHLALGGVMKNCGYDYLPDKTYDQPPIAPQLWHAYHITGDQMVLGVMAALIYRFETGKGQKIDLAVHEAVSKSTEIDLMLWVMRHVEVIRQAGRHAAETETLPTMAHTKDGRWINTAANTMKNVHATAQLLDKYGMADDLTEFARGPAPEEKYKGGRGIPGAAGTGGNENHVKDLVQRFVRRFSFENVPWQEAQSMGIMWAPVVKPHENLEVDHWQARSTFSKISHPELGKSFDYATKKWISTETVWAIGRRAPRLNEDAGSVFERKTPETSLVSNIYRMDTPDTFSKRGKPFPLKNIRIVDFGWFLASAGGTRFLAALGAESIKIEYKTNPDTRFGAQAPEGGRAAREKATGPIPGVIDSNMGGQFNNKNSGKRGISLNIRNPRGKEIIKKLVAISDIVTEGFSPGVLEKLGLGYDELRKINPNIIMIKQSGMGTQGTYGRLRTVGPIASAFSGLFEMSGLPEPAMPVGWGYSYLDWIGAYSFALAILTSLYYQKRTGKGQYIDASQTETGIFLTGVPILEWSANGKVMPRLGNTSPYKKAAPSGAYRCEGTDRWLAISCFTEDEWEALTKVAGNPDWAKDPRFATLKDRLANQKALDKTITEWTKGQNDYVLMDALQKTGVAAGVCQTAGDRCERDPQLAHLEWLTEVTGTKIGRWPIAEMPVKLSETPAYIGGRIDRGAPFYGEDNDYVLGELLGMSKEEIKVLADEDVI